MSAQTRQAILDMEQKLFSMGRTEYEKSLMPELDPKELDAYKLYLYEELEVAQSGISGALLQSGRINL